MLLSASINSLTICKRRVCCLPRLIPFLGHTGAEWDHGRSYEAEKLCAFFQLSFLFSRYHSKSFCHVDRPAMRGPEEKCKKLLVSVFSNPFLEGNCLSPYLALTSSVLPTQLSLCLWRLCCKEFMQKKEIINFQNSFVDLEESSIEGNLGVYVWGWRKEKFLHSVCRC